MSFNSTSLQSFKSSDMTNDLVKPRRISPLSFSNTGRSKATSAIEAARSHNAMLHATRKREDEVLSAMPDWNEAMSAPTSRSVSDIQGPKVRNFCFLLKLFFWLEFWSYAQPVVLILIIQQITHSVIVPVILENPRSFVSTSSIPENRMQ